MTASEGPKPDSFVGTTIDGKYELVRIIGEGGMGVVYEARHKLIGRRLAIKALHPDAASEPAMVERFHNEARIAGSLGHENIIEIADIGQMPTGAPYIVMELLEGESLAHRVEVGGPMKIGDAAEILAQVLDALVAVHEAGVVHRDLKPDNVFLSTRTGATGRTRTVVKLLDFGISKLRTPDSDSLHLTRTGTVLGTPYYMAPEQAMGEKNLDRRVDIYAAGVILYELLTGKRPFEGDSYNALLGAIITKTPLPPRRHRPDIPEAIEEIILRAMHRDRDDRFQCALEFLQALEPFAPSASTELVRSRPRPSAARISVIGTPPALRTFATEAGSIVAPPLRRRTAFWAALGGAALAVAAVVFFALRGSDDEPQRPEATVAVAPAADATEAPLGIADAEVATGAFIVTTAVAKPEAGFAAAEQGDAAADATAAAKPAAEAGGQQAVVEPDASSPPDAATPVEATSTLGQATPPTPRADAGRTVRNLGRLEVLISPPLADTEVYVKGRMVGRTPITGYALEPGDYRVIVVNNRERIRKVVEATIRAGATTTLRLDADQLRARPTPAADAGAPAETTTARDAGTPAIVPSIDEDYPLRGSS
ncbi:MAG: serine/threonine protein kinase [Deltaproteobacteria bacterium]|nr:serine/threonine protein kinase [Deltaproteobacteria bacterium]